MVQFSDWCDSADTPVGDHHLRVMTGRPVDSATGIQVTARALPAHYATEERIAGALARLGKAVAAKMITDLLPQTPQIRSGDLGEIYRPKYFTGGIAVHGSNHVPDYPASHGCVRVSVSAMDWIWEIGIMPLEIPVWVHEGIAA